jgi:hypothetical protein
VNPLHRSQPFGGWGGGINARRTKVKDAGLRILLVMTQPEQSTPT